jgi:16S rRNA (guanine1207-N2)-methyltransferase
VSGGEAHGGGYWSASPPLAARRGEVEVAPPGEAPVRLVTSGHTFSPRRLDPGTALLLRALWRAYPAPGERAPERIADLGAGWGAIGLLLARRFPAARVDLIEVNPAAAAAAAENARRLGLGNARVHLGDVSLLWPALAPHDLVVTNPPIRAGRRVYGPWLTQARDRLGAGGSFWFVARTAQGANTLAALLAAALDEVAVVARGGGYRVVRGRRA